MREDQKRRQPHHTTQHDTIRHTGTTIEIDTGRDETRHDREWRCMAMAMGGEREREERVRHTDRHTERHTDRHTDRGVAGEEGGREAGRERLTSYRMREDQKRRQPHHTTRYDTTHRNNDRDRHRTRRDET
jgi:hypothetical protein